MALQVSGQVSVTTAGTAERGPVSPQGSLFAVKAHPDNTDTMWVGNDGNDDVASGTGFPLNAGEGIVLEVSSLRSLWFDADVDGETICWFRLR